MVHVRPATAPHRPIYAAQLLVRRPQVHDSEDMETVLDAALRYDLVFHQYAWMHLQVRGNTWN
jgi:hypothetical protein